ncbi:hypothetical protein DXG01_012687 [Tephrocybe rancida]|nr:hypothetical protein DXG01_012687 [Tephrocybe rancida]
MKLSLATPTILALLSCAHAIPVLTSIDSLVERGYEPDGLFEREWVDLEARVGDFAATNGKVRTQASQFIGNAVNNGAISAASQPSNHDHTYHTQNGLHLDRQTPTGPDGKHKVAVQLNKAQKGPSTIAQAVVDTNHPPKPETVAAKLRHSLNTGKEQPVHPSAKQQRIAANNAKSAAKKGKK